MNSLKTHQQQGILAEVESIFHPTEKISLKFARDVPYFSSPIWEIGRVRVAW